MMLLRANHVLEKIATMSEALKTMVIVNNKYYVDKETNHERSYFGVNLRDDCRNIV